MYSSDACGPLRSENSYFRDAYCKTAAMTCIFIAVGGYLTAFPAPLLELMTELNDCVKSLRALKKISADDQLPAFLVVRCSFLGTAQWGRAI